MPTGCLASTTANSPRMDLGGATTGCSRLRRNMGGADMTLRAVTLASGVASMALGGTTSGVRGACMHRWHPGTGSDRPNIPEDAPFTRPRSIDAAPVGPGVAQREPEMETVRPMTG